MRHRVNAADLIELDSLVNGQHKKAVRIKKCDEEEQLIKKIDQLDGIHFSA